MAASGISRRSVLAGGAAILAAAALPALGQQSGPAIHVRKNPTCGCCSAWVAILEHDGFAVTVEETANVDLVQYKSARGIPMEMASCHTADVAGYVIEGHVPPEDIRRLLASSPDALGLAVPGMPYGSPGMGPESEREAYDVLLINHDGSASVFSRYEAA